MLIHAITPERVKVVWHDVNHNVLLREQSIIHSITGGIRRLYLPDNVPEGTQFRFVLTEQFQMNIDPRTNKIYAGNDVVDDKYYGCDEIGASMHVCSDQNGDWVVISKSGTWVREV